MKVETAIEAANAAGLASKTTLAGSATAGVGWVASSAFFGWAGIVIAALGLLVNLYYRRKEHQLKLRDEHRKEAEHQARMQAITAKCEAQP